MKRYLCFMLKRALQPASIASSKNKIQFWVELNKASPDGGSNLGRHQGEAGSGSSISNQSRAVLDLPRLIVRSQTPSGLMMQLRTESSPANKTAGLLNDRSTCSSI